MPDKSDKKSSDVKMATNMTVRGHIDALREIMGYNGAKIIFRNIGHQEVYENPPEFDWEPCMTEDDRTMIYTEVVTAFGLKAALSLWRRMGYTTVKYVVEKGHILDSFADLPPDEKFQKSMEFFATASGRGKIEITEDGSVEYDCFNCTTCAPYDSERPICLGFVGSLQYLADWSYGKGIYIVKETKCKSMGDDTCYHVLTKTE